MLITRVALLWISNIAGAEIFGSYNHDRFGWSTMVVSTLFAALTFRLIERPVDALRKKIKREAESVPQPKPLPRPARVRLPEPHVLGVVPGIEAGAVAWY